MRRIADISRQVLGTGDTNVEQLRWVVAELETLISAIGVDDLENELWSEWSVLEQVYAYLSLEGRQTLTSQEQTWIQEALTNIISIVAS